MLKQPHHAYPPHRIAFIDHMRAFLFLLMAFDHALHAYAQNWAPFWFFRDYERSLILDGVYLFNQAIIMPGLFFTFGFYVQEHYKNWGRAAFWQDRFTRFGVPFLLGVPLIVPLLGYPKFHEYVDPNPNFWVYWYDVFLLKHPQAGPFWVMYALLLYSAILLLLDKLFPKLIPWLAGAMTRVVSGDKKPLLFFALFSVVVFTASDLKWGAPWWIGFGKLFYLQGSKFIMNFVYFVLGAALMHSHVFHKAEWATIPKQKFKLLAAVLILGVLYGSYCVYFYPHGAFDSFMYVMNHYHAMGDVILAWAKEIFPFIMGRITMMALLIMVQLSFLLSLFSSLNKKWHPLWNKLALHAWGIFIFHEVIVVWMQFWLVDSGLWMGIKIMLEFFVGVAGAFLITTFLRRVPYAQRIFELK